MSGERARIEALVRAQAVAAGYEVVGIEWSGDRASVVVKACPKLIEFTFELYEQKPPPIENPCPECGAELRTQNHHFRCPECSWSSRR